MKRWLALILCLIAAWQAPAHAERRPLSQPELEALLAPIALYPDSVLSHILVAATRPEDLRQAAAWLRSNPNLSGQQAVQAAEPIPWHPSVKALLAVPDLLARMDESPQWTADLGEAFLEQEPYVMDTVQALRQRAQASGGLHSNEHYSVQQYGSAIAIHPVQPHVVYVPYYNPWVVYGPWWHSYHPVYWRPWHARPAFIGHRHFHTAKVDWPRRHVVRQGVHNYYVRRHESPAPVTLHNHAHPVRPIVQGARIERPARPRPSAPVVESVRRHAPTVAGSNQHTPRASAPMLEAVRRYAPAVNAPVRPEARPANRPQPRRG